MPAPRPDPVISRAEARAAGLSPGQVRHLLKTGRWRAVGNGRYVENGLDERSVVMARARAALSALAHPAAVGYGTAAYLWGLVTQPPDRVQLVTQRGYSRVSGRSRVHHAQLPGGHIDDSLGLPLTSPARTVVDLARGCDALDGVPVADAALRLALATHDEMLAAAAGCAGWPGSARAAWVVAFADGAAESVLESRSRVVLDRLGLPRPELQVSVRGEAGFIGRVDFLWRDAGVVGEADGRGKYDRPEVLWEEKRREDALRDHGLEVVRWSWQDLSRPEAVKARVDRAFDRAGRR